MSKADIPGDRLELARASAGFWHTHISPLHAALIMQSLAQKGAMLRPYIVDQVESNEGEILHKAKTQYLAHTVSEGTAKILLEAMKTTVKRGTARKSFKDGRGVPYVPGVEVTGKTGTLNGSKPYRAYTWFVGAAPADKPEVVVAALIINSPKWRIKASQAAAMVFQKYFELAKKKK